ncbi:MAG TPA: VOC family protein [Actinomycetota bacterium]|jgi:predicted enzyme related to lactoylglutathione lyase
MSQGAIGHVDHVWFWVGDMDRAVEFYRDALGLTLRVRHGDEWTELDGGSVRIGLHGAGGRRVPEGGTAVFQVDDLDLARAGLEARGVAFDEHLGEVAGLARYASFADPDGNRLQIIEYTAEAP